MESARLSYRSFGVAVAAWRARIGLDQAELAALVGLQQSAVSRIENDHHKPAVERLPDFCGALCLSTEEARLAYRLCGIDLAPVLGTSADGSAPGQAA